MSEELELEGKFKTAKELGLSEKQYCGLVQTLAWLEAGKLDHENEKTGGFGMGSWGADDHAIRYGECGSVCCIGGTAEVLGRTSFRDVRFKSGTEIRRLFYPGHCSPDSHAQGWWATTSQAAVALRGYLETGRADWDAAMKTPRKRRK